MGIKTHKSRDGIWRRCSAKGSCPLGGEESHKTFENVQELAVANQVVLDSQGEEAHGLLPGATVVQRAATSDQEESHEDARLRLYALHEENLKKDDEAKRLEVEKYKNPQPKAEDTRPLKEKVEDALKSKWTRSNGIVDEDMVQHSIKSYKYIEVNGVIVEVGRSKPTIESTMYYNDETEAPERNYANFASYNKNLHEPNTYELYGRSHRGDGRLKIVSEDDNVSGFGVSALTYGDMPDHNTREVTEDELKEINAGIEEIRANYDKRLKSYYKRYEDKIRVSGYWANR